MLIQKIANTPTKRLGVVSIALSGTILLYLAVLWNIRIDPFFYREEVQPLSFSVPLKKSSENTINQQDQESAHSNASGLFEVNRDEASPYYGTIWLDRQCFYAEPKNKSWADLSEGQQEELIKKCSVQKFGKRYEWKSSFGDFLQSTTRKPLFCAALFFFLVGILFIVGMPQRLFFWIQKGK